MLEFGFLRVAAGVPKLALADCARNSRFILDLMARAEAEGIDLLVLPELALTGYTCADLFQQAALQGAAVASLEQLARDGRGVYSGVAVVGLPLAVDDQLFNCAAVFHKGRVLGVVPKSFIPNYKEFYEGRWFASAATARARHVRLGGDDVPFGTDILFSANDADGFVLGVEICEDLWVPVPPSSFQAVNGATVLANLSASNEVIAKSAYRRDLVVNQSARCLAAYIYSGSGPGESTTDVVFGGHCLVAENGTLLGESKRFERREQLVTVDIDLDRLREERLRMNSFGDARLYLGAGREFRRVEFRVGARSRTGPLKREVPAHPFVPAGEQLRERCEEIFQIQVTGLARRVEHAGRPPLSIGVSGGLDSTLALLVACRTVDRLGLPRAAIQALTMPGFGTTSRTLANARALMSHLGVTAGEVDIRQLCLDEMKALGHEPFGVALEGLDVDGLAARLRSLPADSEDLGFENVQARARTALLMNRGFVVGTGDLSELALGWSTYNADHMSMYNPNAGIPKTLVKFLVRWAAENEFNGEARRTLLDVVATEISPELLPTGGDGQAVQATERVVGPYELHDFFLFHFLRFGTSPAKILYLARHARFDRAYTEEEVRHWLTVFLRRFFSSQYKRSCLPDGPKVGSVSLSPRGDWRMPSDAQVALWLRELEPGAAPAPEQALRPAAKS